MKKIIKGEIITKKQTINSKKAVMIGCGFVGSASVFALMQSGLFTEIVLIDADKDKQMVKRWILVMEYHLPVQ